MMENKFTPRAEEALRLAQEAAEDMGHGYVGSEHLLEAIEAQAAGLPVVCSEHIPIEALLSPETRRVPLSDAAGWAEALLTAAASETTRDSGPEVCQRFSIDAVAAMIASYYKGEQP